MFSKLENTLSGNQFKNINWHSRIWFNDAGRPGAVYQWITEFTDILGDPPLTRRPPTLEPLALESTPFGAPPFKKKWIYLYVVLKNNIITKQEKKNPNTYRPY